LLEFNALVISNNLHGTQINKARNSTRLNYFLLSSQPSGVDLTIIIIFLKVEASTYQKQTSSNNIYSHSTTQHVVLM